MASSLSTLTFSSRAAASHITTAEFELKSALQERYVKDLWIFLASVIALCTVVNWTSRAAALLFPPARGSVASEKGEDVVPGDTGRLSIRKLPAACSSVFRVIAFRTKFPLAFGAYSSVGELAFFCVYLTVILVLILVNSGGLIPFYYEDRPAHFAASQLPLVVSLAGKNNIISFLTGVGHEKLNVLHRTAARTCLFLLWMHAITHLTAGLPEIFDFTHTFMKCGALGLGAFTLAAILSIRPIRHAAFELFLVCHIVLIAIFLIAGYFHTREFGYGAYLWPALMLWALDRTLRLLRLLWNNRLWKGTNTDYSHATVELVSSDTIRLSLKRRFSWTPGQHAYVVLPTVSALPTEAHPFSIASIPGALDGTAGQSEKDVVFILRVREGFTARLKDHIGRNGKGTVPAFIDGPYGCPPDLSVFSTSVLIAGGSGVSYTLPLLMNLVHLARAEKSSVRRVIFIWVIRDTAHLQWISESLDRAASCAPQTLALDLRIFVTRNAANTAVPAVLYKQTPPSSPASEKNKDLDNRIELVESSLRISQGRPDIHALLREEVQSSPGPVSVDVAGPSELAQTVRRALRSDITSGLGVLRGTAPVTLHVETFGM